MVGPLTRAGTIAINPMKNLLIKWAILTVSVILSAAVCQAANLNFSAKTENVGDIIQVFIGAAVLAFVNGTLGRILKFMTIPFNCLTLGLVSLVINALMLMIVGALGFGFRVDGFLAAFFGSILISAINGILGGLLLPDGKDKKTD